MYGAGTHSRSKAEVTLIGGVTYLVVVILAIELASALIGDAQLALVLSKVRWLLWPLAEAVGQRLRVITARQALALVKPLAMLDFASLEEGVDVLLHGHWSCVCVCMCMCMCMYICMYMCMCIPEQRCKSARLT